MYDTSVLVAHATCEARRFERSSRLVADISNGSAVLVIPMLQVLECFDAIRRIVAKRSKQSEMTSDDVITAIKKATNTFMDFFTLEEKANHAIVLRDHGHADSYFLKVYEKIQQYPIKVVPSNKRYKYRGMGFMDIAYLYYAKSANVRTIYTWDKGFLQAKNDQEFGSISIIILDEKDYA